MNFKELQIVSNKYSLLLILIILTSCGPNAKQNSVGYQHEEMFSDGTDLVLKKELTLDRNKGIHLLGGIPFSGISEEYFPDGKLSKRMALQNGKKHGHRKSWYRNGTLAFDALYVKGKQQGPTKFWYNNGTLKTHLTYVDGYPDGIQKRWYRSGQLFKETHVKNGKEEGMQRAWRKNGVLYVNYEAKNGRTFGLKRAQLCFEIKQLDKDEI